jgi:hypothetical protein
MRLRAARDDDFRNSNPAWQDPILIATVFVVEPLCPISNVARDHEIRPAIDRASVENASMALSSCV